MSMRAAKGNTDAKGNGAAKAATDRQIADCAKEHSRVPGLGPIAMFDALSSNTQCKRLALSPDEYTRTELVRRFCAAYPRDAIPERCKCYRFPETDDFARYSSIWKQLVTATENEDGSQSRVSAKPFMSSYVCFYDKCIEDPNAYRTPRMEADARACPTTVFCKQEVGGINVAGDSVAQVQAKLEQKCGASTTDNPETPEDPEEPKDYTAVIIGAVVGGIVLLVLLAVAFR
jgi:hypothetical protein